MPGLGTIINVAAIIVGGIAGLLFGRRLGERVQESLNAACGVATLFLGIGGAMEKMLAVTEGHLASGGTLMIVLSLALGGFIGGLLDLDDKMVRLGAWLKKKTGNENDAGFIGGFVTASLTVCIGAMAVVGSIQDGLYGDHSTLITKAILDFVIIMVMSASLGKGCLFSFIPVGVFQGSMTLLSRLLVPIMTEAASANLSLVGSILIFCVGVNLIWGPKIKTANLLPSLIFCRRLGSDFLAGNSYSSVSCPSCRFNEIGGIFSFSKMSFGKRPFGFLFRVCCFRGVRKRENRPDMNKKAGGNAL